MITRQTAVEERTIGLILEVIDSSKNPSKIEKVKTVGVTNLVKGERKIWSIKLN